MAKNNGEIQKEQQVPEPEYSNEYVKYQFTQAEKNEISATMARKIEELQSTNDSLKAIKSQFKSDIDKLEAEIRLSATRINNGYEMRTIKCEIVRDFKKGIVQYVRTDNNQIARERNMNSDDRQMALDEA